MVYTLEYREGDVTMSYVFSVYSQHDRAQIGT